MLGAVDDLVLALDGLDRGSGKDRGQDVRRAAIEDRVPRGLALIDGRPGVGAGARGLVVIAQAEEDGEVVLGDRVLDVAGVLVGDVRAFAGAVQGHPLPADHLGREARAVRVHIQLLAVVVPVDVEALQVADVIGLLLVGVFRTDLDLVRHVQERVVEIAALDLDVVAGPADAVGAPAGVHARGVGGVFLGRLVIDDRVDDVLVRDGPPAEAGVVERVLQRHVEVVAEDVLVLQLEDRAAPVILAGLVVAFGLGQAGVPAELLLGARRDQGLEAVVRQDLGVDLEVVVVEQRLILVAGDGVDEDVLDAVSAPPPQLVLDDRAAGVEAEVLDLLDLVDVLDALGLQLGGQVVALEEVVGQVEAAGQAHPVAAAAGDHVQGDAAGLYRDVRRATRGDVQLFEHVEVIIQGGTAEGRRVGDVDAVDRPDVVGALVTAHAARRVAAGHEARLLAGLVAADVLAVDHDGRRELHDDPRVAGRRQGLHGFLVDVLPDGRLLDIDDRRLGDDRDLLFEGSDLEGQVDLDIGAQGDDDAGPGLFFEARELGRDLVVIPRSQGHEAIKTRFAGDRRERGHLGPAQGDADTGQGVAFRVADRAVHVSGSDLRGGRKGQREQGQNDEKLLH